MITRLEDLGELKSLLALHLRDNSKLEILDGFDENMISLQYLNLRYDIFFKLVIYLQDYISIALFIKRNYAKRL